MDVGGFCLTCAEVRSGQVVRWPASIASQKVDKEGENMAAWKKAILSDRFWLLVTIFAVWALDGGTLRCQNFVPGERLPCRTIFVSRDTVTWVLSKMAVQPWSHSCPIEVRDSEVRLSKMWASHAARSSKGSVSSTVCVE